MVHEQRELGKTLLISTHIIDSVSDFFDRALIMQKGVIKANVTREELEENGQTLEELFFAVTEGIGRDEVSGEEFAK
jgi:ABC-2 type transport system ATP-binding protein